MDVAALAKTEFFPRIVTPVVKAALGDCDCKKLCEAAGLNLDDLVSVTFGLAGEDLDDLQGYAVVRGKLDASKIEASLNGTGAYAVERKDGMVVFSPKDTDADSWAWQLALVDGALLIAAPGSLPKLVEAREAGAPRGSAAKLLDEAQAAHVVCAVVGTPAVRASMAADPDLSLFSGRRCR
jgi:hypothetical protein